VISIPIIVICDDCGESNRHESALTLGGAHTNASFERAVINAHKGPPYKFRILVNGNIGRVPGNTTIGHFLLPVGWVMADAPNLIQCPECVKKAVTT